MFIENENLVNETENIEQQTIEENVEDVEDVANDEVTDSQEEQPQEEAIETFTREQVDEMIAKKLARKEARIRKEYDKKYSRLETVVNAGLETNSIEESVEKLENFYTSKGITIPQAPKYTDVQEDKLAFIDANEIIEAGYDEVEEELNRLTELGVDNMSSLDKKIFLKLNDYATAKKTEKEFKAVGLSVDEMNTKEFKDIMDSLNPNLSTKEKLDMYLKLRPKKEFKQIGSVKSEKNNQVKDHYTEEEIRNLTLDDLDQPGVFEAVRRSMTGQ